MSDFLCTCDEIGGLLEFHGLHCAARIATELAAEVARQDAKHGPFEGTPLGRSRLAIACLEDEVAESLEAWRRDRASAGWEHTREEVMQAAAVAVRILRDAL